MNKLTLAIFACLSLSFAAFAAAPKPGSKADPFADPFASPPGGADVRASLVAEQDAIEPGKPVTVGLSLKLGKGWHVYWKNPGGPGFPVSVEWELPAGFKAGEIQWPHPERFDLSGLVNFGYEGDVLLPVEITTPATLKPGDKVELKAKISWLACQDACIPGDADVKLALPVASADAQPTRASKPPFEKARASMPQALSDWKVAAAQSSAGEYTLTVTGPGAEKHTAELYFYPAIEGVVNAEPRQAFELKDGTLLLRLPFAKVDDGKDGKKASAAATRLTGTLVSATAFDAAGKHKALAIDIPVTAGPRGATDAAAPGSNFNAAGAEETAGLPLSLAFAFLGGLILNLMPCVFPVLSIKILSFVKQSGEDRSVVRNHGFLFGAGVLVSFWALAGVLLILRASGESQGWGFQMQEPMFVLGMILLMFAIGLNLAGVFEFGFALSAAAGKVSMSGPSIGAAAGEPSHGKGYGKSFLSGVLATLIATPCTAPFMGAALAAALSMPPWQAMLVFTALGAGMATPYVVLSCVPALLKFMPRPGAWMESFKQFMAFPMFATVAWLAWVYLSITEPLALLKLLLGLTLFGMGMWWYGRWGTPMKTPAVRWIARIGALCCIAVAVWFARYVEPPAEGEPGAVTWEAFSEERLAALRKEGRPILIDFTATWCITCQANKAAALRTGASNEVYRKHNVALLVADWSKKDGKTLKVLQQYGREGVPLYLLFPPDADKPPEILPNLLTPPFDMKETIESVAKTGAGRTAAK